MSTDNPFGDNPAEDNPAGDNPAGDNPFGDNPTEDNPYKPAQAAGPGEKPAGEQQSVSALDAIIPTNPMAAIACYCGIFSILCCFGFGIVLGPIAIALGVMGLRVHLVQESSYGAATSKIRAWIGIITGILGLIINVIVVASMIMNN